MILPLAHIGHWLWVLYLIPVLIVVGGIVHSSRAQKRRPHEDPPGPEGPGGAEDG